MGDEQVYFYNDNYVEYVKEENEKPNLIYVVYDDSRNMYCEDVINSGEYYN